MLADARPARRPVRRGQVCWRSRDWCCTDFRSGWSGCGARKAGHEVRVSFPLTRRYIHMPSNLSLVRFGFVGVCLLLAVAPAGRRKRRGGQRCVSVCRPMLAWSSTVRKPSRPETYAASTPRRWRPGKSYHYTLEWTYKKEGKTVTRTRGSSTFTRGDNKLVDLPGRKPATRSKAVRHGRSGGQEEAGGRTGCGYSCRRRRKSWTRCWSWPRSRKTMSSTISAAAMAALSSRRPRSTAARRSASTSIPSASRRRRTT